MLWRKKPPPIPLVVGDTLNIKALSPRLQAILRACIGKLELVELDEVEREHLSVLYKELPEVNYVLVTRGMFGEHFSPPIEHIRAIAPNPKRK